MNLWKPIVAGALLLSAANANAILLNCKKTIMAGNFTLAADMEWSAWEEDIYPYGIMRSWASDFQGNLASLGETFRLSLMPHNEHRHFIVWALAGRYNLSSEGTSFDFEFNPAKIDWNPDPDDCFISRTLP